ncbi:MAG TPA: GNAT family N-acetyltransferase [Drouetiella sp.]|jgi:ribosomal protein S18 acetylase RimI-like enzyme
MVVKITTETCETLPTYGSVSIAFEVDRIYAINSDASGQFKLTEITLENPYQKDYDALPGNAPQNWSKCFDLTNWGFIVAREDECRVGGAAIAYKSAGVDLLEDNENLALLWDLRVSPEHRGRGLGSKIFDEVEKWCLNRECTVLKIETQNINVAACKFYRRQGCELKFTNRFAYPDLPDEIQMLWYKNLY